MAQESEGEDDPVLDLGTITVTGQKSERSLEETDGSVTVIFPGENDGIAGAADDIFDVTERLANVTPFAASSGVAIRGIGQTGFASGPTFGQTNFLVTRGPSDLVATYVDGIPVSVYAGPFGLWDVDQVEVLRGAQSTVLGRGSLGGAVVIENADPTFTTEAVGQLKTGTNKGGLGTSFAVGGPLVGDRFAYRVAFDRQEDPRFIESMNDPNGRGDQRGLASGRVKLLYAGERGAEVELSAFSSETNVGTHYVDALQWKNGRKVTRANPNTHLQNHSAGASLRGSWPLGHPAFSLESATVWVKEDASSNFDVDQTEIAMDRNNASFNDNIRTVSQELRLRYAGNHFNGFIGAYFEDFQGKGSNESDIFGERTVKQDSQTMVDWQDQQLQVRPDVATAVDFVTENAGRSKSYGLELEADYQSTERLRLFGSLGLLYTEITEATDDRAKDWVGNSFTMAPKTTVSAGWSYAFDHGLDISMAANWRDSLFSDIENRSVDAVDSRFLVDMGIGYRFPDRDLRLDLKVTNVFDQRYLNYSYIQPMVGSDKYGKANSLAARLQGLASLDPGLPQDLLALPSTGTGIVSPGDGRAVSVTLTARF